MPVHVKLSTTLRHCVSEYQPAKGLFLAPDGIRTARDIAQQLNLPLKDITIIMINGVHASLDSLVRDGDQIAFFPAVGGG